MKNTVKQAWAKPKEAARYAGVSERTLREWLKAGLRSIQLPTGTRLIKFGWMDEFLEGFEAKAGPDVDKIVNDICEGLK